MQVGCPSCGTKYVLPPHQARSGVKARCKRCGALFPTMPEEPRSKGSGPKGEALKIGEEASESSGLSTSASSSLEWDGPENSPWGEPGLVDGQGEADSAPPSDLDIGPEQGDQKSGAEGEDPFAQLDAPVEASIPEPPAGHRSRAVGVSAIRAQSISGGVSHAGPGDDPEEGEKKGWLVRVEGKGDVISFKDLVSIRSWMNANPEAMVMLSSDGKSWRSPNEVLDLAPKMSAGTGTGSAPPGTRERRPSAAKRPARAGAGWVAAAGLSTLSMLLVGAITVQNLGAADLSGILPFESFGMRRLMWSSEGATGGRIIDLPPEERYRAALMRGDAAVEDGRLLEAAMAYELAIEVREGLDALEKLAVVYAELGDSERAGRYLKQIEGLGSVYATKASGEE